MKRTSRNLVTLMLGVIVLGALSFVGCTRDEARLEADGPEVYMKDEAFRATLEKQRLDRNAMLKWRDRFVREIEAKIAAKKKAMPSATDDEVRRALEKDPEWNSLVQRLKDLNAAYGESQAKTQATVRERIKPHPVK